MTWYRFIDSFSDSKVRPEPGNEFDPLTNLLSRASFLKTVTEVCKAAGPNQSDTALIVIDISEYHNINSFYGEEIGNRVLQHSAECLNRVCRDGDYLARIGDDQFSLLLTGMLGKEHALLAANKVKSFIGAPLVLNGDELLLRLSMGVALSSQVEGNPSKLFSCAVKALYLSKNTGERVVIYDGMDQAPENHDGVLLLEFSRALEQGKLDLEYQAQQQLSSGRICGAEALLRWQHPKQGNIQPRLIVELAEKIGRGDALSFWVIDKALRSCSHWQKMGMQITISVNLEARTFGNALLPAQVAAALQLWRVEPRFLTLEVTESTLMAKNNQLRLNIEKLNRIGVRVSIDDFGTGYSSLAYLNRLDVHELKIDKSFIDKLESSAKDENLVTAIISLGRNFGLKVIAEGVETNRQYQRLKKMGCDIAQGYFVSRALPFDQFIGIVNERQEPQGRDSE